MFAPPSFPGDLATLLSPPGGGQAQRYIWVADSNGQLHLAPDEATAQAQIPGAQVLLPVIVQPGALPDFTAAQEQAAVAALGQPQRLWATSWFQDTSGYVEIDPNGGFSLASVSIPKDTQTRSRPLMALERCRCDHLLRR